MQENLTLHLNSCLASNRPEPDSSVEMTRSVLQNLSVNIRLESLDWKSSEGDKEAIRLCTVVKHSRGSVTHTRNILTGRRF